MSIRIFPIPHFTYSSTFYSFSVLYEKKSSLIKMRIHNGLYTTSELPQTADLLQEYLPGVFSTDCFNNKNLSFRKEVENTELAHLFEHIMLEYLCADLIQNSNKKIVVNGVTTWNWRIDPMGTYHINIDHGIHEKDVFYQALQQSITLFNTILKSRHDFN